MILYDMNELNWTFDAEIGFYNEHLFPYCYRKRSAQIIPKYRRNKDV